MYLEVLLYIKVKFIYFTLIRYLHIFLPALLFKKGSANAKYLLLYFYMYLFKIYEKTPPGCHIYLQNVSI